MICKVSHNIPYFSADKYYALLADRDLCVTIWFYRAIDFIAINYIEPSLVGVEQGF